MVSVTTPFSLAAGCPLIPDIINTGELGTDFTEEGEGVSRGSKVGGTDKILNEYISWPFLPAYVKLFNMIMSSGTIPKMHEHIGIMVGVRYPKLMDREIRTKLMIHKVLT